MAESEERHGALVSEECGLATRAVSFSPRAMATPVRCCKFLSTSCLDAFSDSEHFSATSAHFARRFVLDALFACRACFRSHYPQNCVQVLSAPRRLVK